MENLRAFDLLRVAEVEMRCLPAVMWLEQSGAPFDTGAWRALAWTAMEDQVRAEMELDWLLGHYGLDPRQILEQAGLNPQNLLEGERINWAAPMQVKAVLTARGHDVDKADDDVLQRLDLDGEYLARVVLRLRDAQKRATTYGLEYLSNVHEKTGRIHAHYLQLGAQAGRFSSRKPNLQQVPRLDSYRACFRPAPGRVLIKADYNQIELRLAAQFSGDERMIEAYKTGLDLHKLTASQVFGAPIEEVTPEQRQNGKNINFGYVYSMGATRFRLEHRDTSGRRFTQEEAERFKMAYFALYPSLGDWQRRQGDISGSPGIPPTRTVLGRWRLGVQKYPERLNSPVQGTGADGLKLALALLWETREQVPSAAPVLCIHDEIVLESDERDAERAQEWLVDCMTRGMATVLHTVPVVVEASIRPTWADPPGEKGHLRAS
jgi:DNA polymerase-1